MPGAIAPFPVDVQAKLPIRKKAKNMHRFWSNIRKEKTSEVSQESDSLY